MSHSETAIEGLEVTAYRIPTDGPESNGTLEWDSTTVVLVQVRAANVTGVGFSYASESTAVLIREKLKSLLLRSDALDTQGIWKQTVRTIRNLGRPGINAAASSCRTCTNRISFCRVRSDSMIPFMPSPGSPKITSTPHSFSVSIRTSAPVLPIKHNRGLMNKIHAGSKP